MFQLLPCPACEKTTALTESVSKATVLRCPHCGHEFSIGELLETHFAEFEVLTSPFSLADKSSSPTITPPEPNDGDDLVLQEDDSIATDPSAEDKWKGFQPITHEQFEKLKRKNRSPLWSVLSVIVGGIAAFPIALAILWYGFGRDILDAGPIVAGYAPWLVPEQFHPPKDNISDESPAEPRRGGFRNFDDELREPSEPASTLKDSADQTNNGQRTNADVRQPGASETTQAKPNDRSVTRASIEAQFPFTQGLFQSIIRYDSDLVEWMRRYASPQANRKELAKSLYGDLLSIAKQLNDFPGESPAFQFVRNELQYGSSQIRRHPETQDLIRQGAEFTLRTIIDSEGNRVANSSSSPLPLAAVIRIGSATREPDNWVIKLSAPENPDRISKLTVNVPRYLSPALSVNQSLFVLGIVSPASTADESSTLAVNYLYSLGSEDLPKSQSGVEFVEGTESKP